MKAFTPTVASANTSSAVRGAAATPIVPSAIQPSAGVKMGGNHMPKGKIAVSSIPATPTHSYGKGTISVSHPKRGF